MQPIQENLKTIKYLTQEVVARLFAKTQVALELEGRLLTTVY